MKEKTNGKALLLLVAAVTLLYSVRHFVPLGETATAETSKIETTSSPNPAQAEAAKVENPNRVMVYYFHGNKRCSTCLLIESLTASAVQTGFREQLDKGEVEWKVVNVDLPKNEHYVWKYKLTFRAVVIARFIDGQEKESKTLDGIWQLVRNEEGFRNYVQGEISNYLKGSAT